MIPTLNLPAAEILAGLGDGNQASYRAREVLTCGLLLEAARGGQGRSAPAVKTSHARYQTLSTRSSPTANPFADKPECLIWRSDPAARGQSFSPESGEVVIHHRRTLLHARGQ